MAKPYKGRGLDGVRADIGEKLWKQVLVHDDGGGSVGGQGGERVLIIGSMGEGKTTIFLKIPNRAAYLSDYTKEMYFALEERGRASSIKLNPETILIRGLKSDYWNALIPENYRRSYPGSFCKPIRVHYNKPDHKYFSIENPQTKVYEEIKDIDIKPYRDINELFSNIVDQGINIVYEPRKYYLPRQLIEMLNSIRLKQENAKEFLDPNASIPIRSPVFWFEVFEYMYNINANPASQGTRKWWTVIMDEAHQVFPSNQPESHWWLIYWFAESLIDTRRWNITLFASTHTLSMIDYRVLDRFGHFIWMGGSHPREAYSRVKPQLVRQLKKGTVIIEKKQREFGKLTFDRIPNQPPVLYAEDRPDEEEQRRLEK